MAKWIQKARERMKRKGTVGSFTRAAARHGKSPAAFEHEVLSHKGKFGSTMVKKDAFRKAVT